MTVEQLIRENGIERIVYVPASDLLPRAEYHAWEFGEYHQPGVGATVEAAIRDAANRRMARAA